MCRPRGKNCLPAILSAAVCPGLGQMVKGEVLKGIGILVALSLGLFVTVVVAVASIQIGIVLSACLVGGYFWNIYDASTSKVKISVPDF